MDPSPTQLKCGSPAKLRCFFSVAIPYHLANIIFSPSPTQYKCGSPAKLRCSMACHTNCVIMSDYKNVSLSKKVRSLKRLFNFYQSKVSFPCKSKKNLSFSSKPATSFYPITPKVSITVLLQKLFQSSPNYRLLETRQYQSCPNLHQMQKPIKKHEVCFGRDWSH